MAICAAVTPRALAIAASASASFRFCAKLSPWKRGVWARKSPGVKVVPAVNWPVIRPRDSTP